MKGAMPMEGGLQKLEQQLAEAKVVLESLHGNGKDGLPRSAQDRANAIRNSSAALDWARREIIDKEAALKKVGEECRVAKLRASEADAQFEDSMKNMEQATIFQAKQAESFGKVVKEWAAKKAEWEERDKERAHDLEQAETKLEQFKEFAELSQSQGERLKGELEQMESEVFKLKVLLEDREAEISRLKSLCEELPTLKREKQAAEEEIKNLRRELDQKDQEIALLECFCDESEEKVRASEIRVSSVETSGPRLDVASSNIPEAPESNSLRTEKGFNSEKARYGGTRASILKRLHQEDMVVHDVSKDENHIPPGNQVQSPVTNALPKGNKAKKSSPNKAKIVIPEDQAFDEEVAAQAPRYDSSNVDIELRTTSPARSPEPNQKNDEKAETPSPGSRGNKIDKGFQRHKAVAKGQKSMAKTEGKSMDKIGSSGSRECEVALDKPFPPAEAEELPQSPGLQSPEHSPGLEVQSQEHSPGLELYLPQSPVQDSNVATKKKKKRTSPPRT